jgi:hypothetical protein
MSEAENFSKSSWIETKEKEVRVETDQLGEEMDANGGHWCDRTLTRTWSRHDRMRLVSVSCYTWHGVLGFAMSASGHAPREQCESQS